MNEFVVREASLDDVSALLALEQKIIESERPYDAYLKEQNVHYYDIPDLITNANSYLVVVESDGSIVGSGYAQIRSSKACHQHDVHCYLGFIYVEPQFRGKALGVKIIDTLKAWGIEKGIKHFPLDVYSENAPAIRAYEKAGYAQVLVTMKLVV